MKRIIIAITLIATLMANPALAAPINFVPITINSENVQMSWGATPLYINENLSLAFIPTMRKFFGDTRDLFTANISLSKSTDGGLTWSSSKRILGTNFPNGGGGYIMPNPVYDPVTNKIFLFYAYYDGNSKLMVMESNDYGETWVNNTFISTGKNYVLPGSSAGIVLSDGTLIIPIAYSPNFAYYICSVLRSTDHGATWQVGGKIDYAFPVGNGVDEPAIIELSNGNLLAYVRTNQGFIGESRSIDKGITWTPVTLTGFPSIMGMARGEQVELRNIYGIIYLAYAGDSETTLNVGKLRTSSDDGQTWSEAKFLTSKSGSANSFYHISQVAWGRAVITWLNNDNNLCWAGEAYRFDIDYPIFKVTLPLPKQYYPQPVTPPYFMDNRVNNRQSGINILGYLSEGSSN